MRSFLAEAAANHGKKVFLEDEESGGGGHRMFNKFLPRNVRFTLVRLHVVAKRKLAATLAGRRQRVLLLATVAATVSILLFLSLFTSVFSRLDFGIQRGAMLSAGIYNLTANGGFKQQSLIVDGSTTTELHQQQYIPHIIHQSWKTVDVPKVRGIDTNFPMFKSRLNPLTII